MDDQILGPDNREDFPEDFNRPKTGFFQWLKLHKPVAIMAGAFVLLLVVASLWLFRDHQEEKQMGQPNVILNIDGPSTLASGNEGEFVISYINGENADLSGITLEVFYPTNFKFASSTPKPAASNGQRFDLPVLRQGQVGTVTIQGKINGATGESKEIRARLAFTPANFSSEFTANTSFQTTLAAPEMELEITGPTEATNGQNLTFTVNYKNVSTKQLDATAIELKYPEGFKFTSSVPAPSKNNNYWTLGNLTVGSGGKIEVTGSFTGDPNSTQLIAGDFGIVLASGFAPQIHASAEFKIISSTLSLTQKSDPQSNINLGQELRITLDYGNYGTSPQTNVVIAVTLDGVSLDLPKIKTSTGIITGNVITWKSATVNGLSQLMPNQKGQVSFTVPLKPNISTNLKNQIIKSSTTIASDQTPVIRGQEISLKLNSELALITSGRFVSGAMPMQVGQSTLFEITLLLTNLGNDISDTSVVASLPLPSSAWVDIILPDSEKQNVTFDKNAGKIRWKPGNLAAFVGKYSPARTLSFRLQVTPEEKDRGSIMTLLKDIQATATDTFTEKELTSTKLDQLKVNDLEDDTVDATGGGAVQ